MLAYKSALHGGTRVLITLELPDDANTNMERTSVAVKETAQYRANKVKVIKIEDEARNTYDTATSRFFCEKVLTYTVGQTLEEPTYEMNAEVVNGPGIHFFLSKRVAELYAKLSLENGLFQRWYENGQLEVEIVYVNGEPEGVWRSWYATGQKKSEVTYVDGKLEGLWQGLYENGQLQLEVTCVDGKLTGTYHSWYVTGQKHYEMNYENSVPKGLLVVWGVDGTKLQERIYENGMSYLNMYGT